ncbi:ABC transporter permease [Sedimentibacter hydroxybenzoicus DSM 7310]|uniref:ABC transporter permease n=1 Tax=Sedimentibacter hydroxybenzoicus DSM 7310 TaxID=1123245 RepID=A0A974BL81_SEDHY|nr:ABC transporter permease [Sedimentibacter hydroxybenzoicus]NYB75405.1 ABC transporter permease [Sedimentibacter hydroxybenzoicus DSM 7310]
MKINIIKKDLKIILSDKKALAIMILMPIILTTILSMALKGSFASGDSDFEPINIAVVKLYDEKVDNQMFESSLKNSLVADSMGEDAIQKLIDSGEDINPENLFFDDFLESKDVSELIKYTLVSDEKKALNKLNNEEVSAIVLLPDKFIYNMKVNLLTPFRNKVDIKILTHPDKSLSGKIVSSVIDAYSNAMSTIIIGKNVVIETSMTNNISDDGFDNLDQLMEGISDVIKSIDVNLDNVVMEGRKQVNSADYYAVGMMTMFILFAAGIGGRMLLEEKDNQTYQRMVIAGTTKLEILSGNFMTVFLIALLQITVMITFTHFALKVQWGNIGSVILISIVSAFAVAGLGSFVGALTYKAGNYKMANMFESAIIQVMALLGGSFFPIDVMPEFMQNLSFLSLNGIAIRSYLKIITGYAVADILNHILMLIAMGMIFMLAAVFVLKGKEGTGNVKRNKVKIA